MTRTIVALFCLLMTLGAARADSLPPPGGVHLPMTLVAESRSVPAGGTVTLAIDSRPAPGWHGYWGENPGDAGFPPRAAWTLPPGASVGAWRWPIPTTLTIAGLMNYVYDRPFAPLIELRVPAGLAAGTALPVRLKLSYLVCTAAICVPEEQALALDLTVGDGAPRDARFDAWRRAVPRPLGAQATYAVSKEGLRLAIPYPAGAPLADAYFFPKTIGAINYAAPQAITRDGDRLLLVTAGKTAGPIDGVLRIGAGQGLEIHAVPGALAGGGGGEEGWARAALLAFAGALLGGLILNVMPCVFPILSLKALSLARSGASAAHARSEALAYTAGVVLVCLTLGGIILALRAGGASVGWAFQLQNPVAVLLLLLLTAGIAFSLAGLFELPMPPVGELAGKGGAFMTGALAAIIATPCTGPFMGAALGAALVLPWPAALAVFAGLGIGLALPFLAVGFVPALRNRLPRPGAWMELVRRVLAVPMFLTAIALGWVLGRQAGVDALTFALALTLLLAVLLWAVGAAQAKGRGIGPALLGGLVVIGLLGATLLPVERPAAAATAGAAAFSEARLTALRAQRRPVFAYFTADWCLTCKVNERVAIDTATAQAAFRRKGVAVLVGDWTGGDPALGRFIEAHNRAGVPLYLYYAPGAAEPRVLPQVLTPGLLAAL